MNELKSNSQMSLDKEVPSGRNEKLQIKSLERPRRHSPMKSYGIEDYIKSYEMSKESHQAHGKEVSKIEINLKMDDLLANVSSGNANYQVLSELSFLHGDSDLVDSTRPKSKASTRRNSKKYEEYEPHEAHGEHASQFQQEDDGDDDDDNNVSCSDEENRNLQYKYSASYRKDDATGSFQENSKIIFENKKESAIDKPFAPNKSAANFPMTNVPKQTSNPQSTSHTTGFNAAEDFKRTLEVLKNNSLAFDSKAHDSSDITLILKGVKEIPKETSGDEGKEVKMPTIKIKNDSFFNEFLNKSDELIAKTQIKLEKLSKLESIHKGLARSENAEEKTKAVDTAEKKHEAEKDDVESRTSGQNSQVQSLAGKSVSSSLRPVIDEVKNSASLIDLKSSDSFIQQKLQIDKDVAQHGQDKAQTESDETTMKSVDLIFEKDIVPVLSNDSLVKSDYNFELFDFGSTPSQHQSEPPVKKVPSLNADISELMGIAECANEHSAETECQANENEAGHREDQAENDPQVYLQMPSIDILITEPTNEQDESNIVPENFFNLKNEIPRDQSRPNSPSSRMGVEEEKKQSRVDSSHDLNSSIKYVKEESSVDMTMDLSLPNLEVFDTKIEFKDEEDIPLPVLPLSLQQESLSASFTSSITDISNKNAKSPKSHTRKKKEKDTRSIASSVFDKEREDDTSSSSSSSEEEVKLNIRIRPKPRANSESNNDDSSLATNKSFPAFVPLLPKPPQSIEEINSLRERRLSSNSSQLSNKFSDSDDDENHNVRSTAKTIEQEATTSRKGSLAESEFNLELPDKDDLLSLTDFNEKSNVKKYSDGSHGCFLLVRQPFRQSNMLYKNVLQKLTEVRTWTEYLVRLVHTQGKRKLLFYNCHELMSLAAEKDCNVDMIVENAIIRHAPSDHVSKELPTSQAEEEARASNVKNERDEGALHEMSKVEPFYEVELKSCYKLGELSLQDYDNFSKIHTFKIQEFIYKETLHLRSDRIFSLPERLLKKVTKPKATTLIDNTPIPIEISKFAHSNHTYLKEFFYLLQDEFWTLPTQTRKEQREQKLKQINESQPSAFSLNPASLLAFASNKQIKTPTLSSITAAHIKEEVTLKVVDEYKAVLDNECRILQQRSRTRVFLTVFLNATDPVVEVGMNDVLRHGKEIVGRSDIIQIKTEQWIAPELYELNENVVDKDEFDKTHLIKCVKMPDNTPVEIIRFRTRPRRNFELPLRIQSFMNVTGRKVDLRIECTLTGTYFTNNEAHCENIQIRFPLPDTWVYMFRVEKRFRYGAVHSSKQKMGKIKGLDRLLVHKSSPGTPLMEASCGLAKYEQAFKSLVWRIDELPIKNKDIFKTHLFRCRFELQEYDSFPPTYEPNFQIQYSISKLCVSSKSQARSISVTPCDGEQPDKWAKLKSVFEYTAQINYSFDETHPASTSVDESKFEQVEKISIMESESENNRESADEF